MASRSALPAAVAGDRNWLWAAAQEGREADGAAQHHLEAERVVRW